MKPGPKRLLKRSLLILAALLALLLVAASGLAWYLNPAVERRDGIVYGERNGRELTLDLVTPARPKGAGIILIVSGGWKSKPDSFRVWMAAPLLRRGYTVFAVSHLSQPAARVQDTVADIARAVRFIRHHAPNYGVDPGRLGITGGSAGGHLSLMQVTRGGPGPEDALDPVDRESSAVQAAAVFFPVTNLLELGSSTENLGDGGPPKSFRKAFGTEADDLDRWRVIAREISPVYHVHADQPPALLIHGDADTLTPLEQSQWFRKAAADAGATIELLVHRGGRHGWLTMPLDVRRFAAWFDRHLE